MKLVLNLMAHIFKTPNQCAQFIALIVYKIKVAPPGEGQQLFSLLKENGFRRPTFFLTSVQTL